MATRKARELAAQAWCEPETSHLILEPALAEAFAKIIDEIWVDRPSVDLKKPVGRK